MSINSLSFHLSLKLFQSLIPLPFSPFTIFFFLWNLNIFIHTWTPWGNGRRIRWWGWSNLIMHWLLLTTGVDKHCCSSANWIVNPLALRWMTDPRSIHSTIAWWTPCHLYKLRSRFTGLIKRNFLWLRTNTLMGPFYAWLGITIWNISSGKWVFNQGVPYTLGGSNGIGRSENLSSNLSLSLPPSSAGTSDESWFWNGLKNVSHKSDFQEIGDTCLILRAANLARYLCPSILTFPWTIGPWSMPWCTKAASIDLVSLGHSLRNELGNSANTVDPCIAATGLLNRLDAIISSGL